MMENDNNMNAMVTSSLNLQDLCSFSPQVERSFSDSSSQLDEDKCYLMEIEQLKRENNFLRKKLAQTQQKKRLSAPLSTNKRMSFNFGSVSQQVEEPKNYIISFIDEIVKLLENFSSLFNIQLQSTLSSKLEQQNLTLNSLNETKDHQLNRRISKLLLAPQEHKYNQLLHIFQDYYQQTSNRSKKVRKSVQMLTTQAIQLGKQMANSVKERTTNKKQHLKGSTIFSSIQEPENMEKSREDALKSSIIKSTCDGQMDFKGCKSTLGKDRFFLNIF